MRFGYSSSKSWRVTIVPTPESGMGETCIGAGAGGAEDGDGAAAGMKAVVGSTRTVVSLRSTSCKSSTESIDTSSSRPMIPARIELDFSLSAGARRSKFLNKNER